MVSYLSIIHPYSMALKSLPSGSNLFAFEFLAKTVHPRPASHRRWPELYVMQSFISSESIHRPFEMHKATRQGLKHIQKRGPNKKDHRTIVELRILLLSSQWLCLIRLGKTGLVVVSFPSRFSFNPFIGSLIVSSIKC